MVERILYALKKSKRGISFDDLISKLEITSESEIEEAKQIIDSLKAEYEVYCSPKGNLQLMSKTSFKKGRFHGYRSGDGKVYVTVSYIDKLGNHIVKEEEYSIEKDNNGGAIDGDEVLIDVDYKNKTCKIVEIINRSLNSVVGEVYREGAAYFVRPLDKKRQGIIIALEGEQIEGQIVSVDLVDQRSTNFYIGKVAREFNHKDDPNEDALLEAFKCGMPEGFSKESLEQLKYIPREVREEDKEGRYDFTDWEIFSIDGKDTKDKDDCISLTKLSNGNVLLGVHIADVAYYVPQNSPIDVDAFTKGTSYYFGGCVEPQLPHQLSNGICSLNDSVERLTKSILIEYDENCNVVSRSLVPSVIKSKIGMNYDDANKLLKDGVVAPGYEDYFDTLIEMRKLAKKLSKKRRGRGAIEFARPELKFIYDEDGKPIDVTFRYQDLSENLIEEFMLAANVNVGEILTEAGIPCIYRIHDVPNAEKLKDFLRLLDIVGMPFEFGAHDICEDKRLLQLLTEHINKNEELRDMLNANLIRCMSHAKYSVNNIGHYGTGFDVYCHFTSPIRRLADLGICRIIDDCYFEKDKEKRTKGYRKWKALAPEFAMQATKMERVEEEIERNVDAMNTAVYLSNYIGEEFEGTIVEMGQNAITIQLDNLLEGRIKTRSLPGRYYYNNETFTMISLDGFENYYIGDRLRMKLVGADKDSKTVDFKAIEKVHDSKFREVEEVNQKVKTREKERRSRRNRKK